MFGAERTSGPLRMIYEAIFGHVNSDQWGQIHLALRKSGHFLGYGVIGLCWLRAWHMTVPRLSLRFDALLALLGTALISGSDEFHQTFLPDRTGMFSDVLLDCSGALVMLAILLASRKLSSRSALASHRQ